MNRKQKMIALGCSLDAWSKMQVKNELLSPHEYCRVGPDGQKREKETAKESSCSVDQTPCTYMDFHGGASLHATHSFLEVFQDIPITVCNYPSQGSRNSTRHDLSETLPMLRTWPESARKKRRFLEVPSEG